LQRPVIGALPGAVLYEELNFTVVSATVRKRFETMELKRSGSQPSAKGPAVGMPLKEFVDLLIATLKREPPEATSR
jgi:hypothetical protein